MRVIDSVIPVVTPAEMAAIDRDAPEPVDVLVARAGWAVAGAAVDMMGGTYGRRVVVVAGKGNNGADGRYAAGVLARRGVRVRVVDAAGGPAPTRPRGGVDLVIDAAYGTGFRGEYQAPDPGRRARPRGRHPVGRRRAHRRRRAGRGPGRPHRHLRRPQAGPPLPPGTGVGGRVDVVDIGLDVVAADHPRGRARRRRRVGAPAPGRHPQVEVGGVGGGGVGRDDGRRPPGGPGRHAGGRGHGPPGHPRRARPTPPLPRGRGPAAPGRGVGRRASSPTSGGRRRWWWGPASGRADAAADAVRRLVAGARRCRPSSTPTASTPWGRPRRPPPSSAPRPRPPSSRPTTASSSASPAIPPGPDRVGRRPRPGRPHPRHGAAQGPDDGRGRPRRARCCCRPRATSGWPPPAPATCWPASSAPTWPRASTACGRRPRPPSSTGGPGHLGWRHGLVAGDLLDLLPAVLDRGRRRS